MKAKKLKEKAEINTKDFDPLSNNRKIYGFTKKEFDQFCNQLCKEQRKLCANHQLTADSIGLSIAELKELRNNVINAPQPEL